jgi:hypothetical protein
MPDWRRLALALLLLALPAAARAQEVRIRADRWTEAEERGFGNFLAAIGDSSCRTLDSCLRGPANPLRGGETGYLEADCADLPYVLRFYYAWKRGLPFSYVSEVSPRGRSRDIRYSPAGNRVEARRDILSGADGMRVLDRLRDEISSATYRIHPQSPGTDFYSPAIVPGAIRPGTVIYDPNGHLAVIFRIEPDGRIRYLDAHPDNSLTRGVYDGRFVRASPGMGAGFKNWRPLQLVGAEQGRDGTLWGGRIIAAPDSAISDFALTQYFGTGARLDDSDWRQGRFILNGRSVEYYDYVRARLGGGQLRFDPIHEVGEMVASDCADLTDRVEAVRVALTAGIPRRPHPERLPANIYGTEGDWETYATPSRDARLRTAFKQLRDAMERYVELWRSGDPRLVYDGGDLPRDLLAAYDTAAARCRISYRRSDGAQVSLGYEEARRRLFRLSFDPYHCAERRWGAQGEELESCPDGTLKRRWYAAEQGLRNQLDRSYEARTDFTLQELEAQPPGAGPQTPPDTDARGYLVSQLRPGRFRP